MTTNRKKAPAPKKSKEIVEKSAIAPKEEKPNKPSRGICIIAIGHVYYGAMAVNLAMSIKYQSPGIPIAFIGNARGHMNAEKERFFDHFIDVPEEYMTSGGQLRAFKAKLHIAELSPFDETLLLDADQAFLPKRPITQMMDELSKSDFKIQCRGSVELKQNSFPDRAGIWCSMEELKKEYGIKSGKYYNVSTEVLWFKKTKKVIELFEEAAWLYDNLKINHTIFGGGVPDELPMSIAMINKKFKVKDESWTPSYWEQQQNCKMQPREMHQQFYLYSMGGHLQQNHVKNYYNDLVRYYCKSFHIKHPWLWKDKRGWAHSRSNL